MVPWRWTGRGGPTVGDEHSGSFATPIHPNEVPIRSSRQATLTLENRSTTRTSQTRYKAAGNERNRDGYSSKQSGNKVLAKIVCIFLIICFAVAVAGVPIYFIHFERGDDSKSTSSQSPQETNPRSEQIRRSLPDKFDKNDDESMGWLRYQDTWTPPIGVEDFQSYWRERYALAKFYHSTNGKAWRFDNSWLGPTSVCEWLCCEQEYKIECDDNGRVTLISFGKWDFIWYPSQWVKIEWLTDSLISKWKSFRCQIRKRLCQPWRNPSCWHIWKYDRTAAS